MSSTEGQVAGGDGVLPDSYWGEQSTDRLDSPLSSCISNGNRSINTHFIQEKKCNGYWHTKTENMKQLSFMAVMIINLWLIIPRVYLFERQKYQLKYITSCFCFWQKNVWNQRTRLHCLTRWKEGYVVVSGILSFIWRYKYRLYLPTNKEKNFFF